MKKVILGFFIFLFALFLLSCNYDNITHVYIGDILEVNEIGPLSTKNSILFADDMVSTDELLTHKSKIEGVANNLLQNPSEVTVSNKELRVLHKIPIFGKKPIKFKYYEGLCSLYVDNDLNVNFKLNKELIKEADERITNINFQFGIDNGTFSFNIVNDLRKKVKLKILVDSLVDGEPVFANKIIELGGRDNIKIAVSNVSDFLINQGTQIRFMQIIKNDKRNEKNDVREKEPEIDNSITNLPRQLFDSTLQYLRCLKIWKCFFTGKKILDLNDLKHIYKKKYNIVIKKIQFQNDIQTLVEKNILSKISYNCDDKEDICYKYKNIYY